jgi:hypothetical protein
MGQSTGEEMKRFGAEMKENGEMEDLPYIYIKKSMQ